MVTLVSVFGYPAVVRNDDELLTVDEEAHFVFLVQQAQDAGELSYEEANGIIDHEFDLQSARRAK